MRLVSVDFGGGIPELREIHAAGGGTPDDLLVINPNAVIGRLHELGLTALPQVFLARPMSFDADPAAFERHVEIELDEIAEAVLIAIEFHPAIAKFADHASLKVMVGGNELAFSVDNDDPNCLLAFDTKGNVATATLILENVPDNRRVSFRFASPTGSLHAPACTVYTYFRLADDLTVDLRPKHMKRDSQPPFRISPNHSATWRCVLERQDEPKPYPLESVEAVLRHAGSGSVIRLDFQADPQSPGVFLSDETRIPPGTYDVELYILLPSRAKVHLTLPRHVESQLSDEPVTMDIHPAGDEVGDGPGPPRSHLAFGPVGDAVSKKSLIVGLRSLDVDYSITVVPSADIADAEGHAPRQKWIGFDRAQLTLSPGRPEKLRVTLSIPGRIEETIQDGPFQGRFALVRTDTGEPVPIRLYRRIEGVGEDEPVDRITFTLARPKMTVRAVRCFRDRIRTRRDGAAELPVRLDFGTPYEQLVAVDVGHDSVLPRQFTILPSAILCDPSGRQVPTVRLAPLENTELTQEIPTGGTARWLFRLTVDADCRTEEALGSIDITAAGLAPRHLALAVRRRTPPLTFPVKVACWCLAAGLSLFALRAAHLRRRAARFRSGRQHVLTLARPLSGALAIAPDFRGGVHLVPQQPTQIAYRGDPRKKTIAAGRPVRIDEQAISAGRPCLVELKPRDGREGPAFEINDCLTNAEDQPELAVEVVSGGQYDRLSRRYGRALRSRLLLAVLCGALALTLGYPFLRTAAQWAYDFLTL